MRYSKPTSKPLNVRFSSGPTSKRPGWSVSALNTDSLGRSHRAGGPKSRIADVSNISREILGIPHDYLLGMVPASDTGAFEMALWSMLGQRGVDVLAWESFGQGWLADVVKQLRLTDVREFTADYGSLPDLYQVDGQRDVVFTWNGTTAGTKVPNADWIDHDRQGLTFCDATSAVFAMNLEWEKLDVITWSWQKALGGEAAHGMLALSPRAVARLENYIPDRPLPKIFRLTKGGKLIAGIFEGSTINTPSLLAVEDQLDALGWAMKVGGLQGLIGRSEANLAVVSSWVSNNHWIDFLAEEEQMRSSTSICLKITDAWFTDQSEDAQRKAVKEFTSLLEQEQVAYDIAGHRDAPPGLRIWGGGTVESSDLELLTPWLSWAYQEIKDR